MREIGSTASRIDSWSRQSRSKTRPGLPGDGVPPFNAEAMRLNAEVNRPGRQAATLEGEANETRR